MLISIVTGRPVTDMPYPEDFARWRARLSDDQYEAIRAELSRRLDEDTIHTSSWIPGNDWRGTVYEPIYTKACDGDRAASGRCFGLFLWRLLQDHPARWGFDRIAKIRGVPVSGLTYFMLDRPAKPRQKKISASSGD